MINILRDQLIKDLKNAYRKWKSATYFDSFLITEANKLAFFELEENILESDLFFENFADELLDPEKQNILFEKIYLDVKVRCYPKSTNSDKSEVDKKKTDKNEIIDNSQKQQKIKKALYMIDLPIKAHILGALWTMKFGVILDKELSVHCFGNRIREALDKDDKDSNKGPVPYLYYPYFKKYVSWRDEGIKVLEQLLDLKLNAVMITLDIKNYFYNCRVDFAKLKNEINENSDADQSIKAGDYDFLHDLIENIFKKYAQFFSPAEDEDKNPLIPVGFLPSYVISNWYLKDFDSVIKKDINPQYYGRYVDDILLVFSINDEGLNKTSKKKKEEKPKPQKEEILSSLLGKYKGIFRKPSKTLKSKAIYEISGKHLRGSSHPLSIEEQKVKVFYFSHLHSRVLIEMFKKTILSQSSVFLYLHESNDELVSNNQPDFWKINYSDTHNKLRSVEDVEIDKFSLSKWLSFLVNSSSDLSNKSLARLEKILFETLADSGYLGNFNLWEKYLTIFLKHSRHSALKRFFEEAVREIDAISEETQKVLSENNIFLKSEDDVVLLKKTLFETLFALLEKVFSLKGKREIKELEKEIRDVFEKFNFVTSSVYLPNSKDLFKEKFREAFLRSYMFNNQIVHYPLLDKKSSIGNNYDLLGDDLASSYIRNNNGIAPLDHLKYFPRYIHFHEIQMCLLGYPHQKSGAEDKGKDYETIWGKFWKLNYGNNGDEIENKSISVDRQNSSNDIHTAKISVDKNVKKTEFRIGIANVNVDFKAFERVLRGKSSFLSAYQNKAVDVINYAIKEKVDFLVLPECYVHHTWINKMIRVARDHQMGMVFGLEHIVDHDGVVYNYIVTLLPYTMGGFHNCAVEIRLKNHYSPSEKKYIGGYFLKTPDENRKKNYIMYNWKGMSFAPYCCFEIASIEERALFKSKIDTVVVVEWNRDVEYFSSIIESLSRDLHCYCIQVNSSQYGDNRITQPASSYRKDIAKAKGGLNDYLIVEKINIEDLRNFQIQAYGLQEGNEKFKPTPPGFDPEEVNKR